MRHRVRLDPVQETLVIPLYGRAVETGKPRGVLRDETAVEIVARLDYDFTKFDGGASLLGTVLRTVILDTWARDFLRANPHGTVVELGAGLGSRHERLDNGTCHWFDLDLPDVIELRRQFFTDTARRHTIAASIEDLAWMDVVAQRPGPFLFLADGVLPYLEEEDAHRVLAAVAREFSGSLLGFDTCGRTWIDTQDRHDSMRKMAGRMRWACDDPGGLRAHGLELRESLTLVRAPADIWRRLPLRDRLLFRSAALVNLRGFRNYRVNLLQARA